MNEKQLIMFFEKTFESFLTVGFLLRQLRKLLVFIIFLILYFVFDWIIAFIIIAVVMVLLRLDRYFEDKNIDQQKKLMETLKKCAEDNVFINKKK